MAYKTNIAWQPITSDMSPDEVPQAVLDAAAELEAARENFESAVDKHHPAPSGRRWKFSYKYGQAIGLGDAPKAHVNYFAKR